MAHAERSRQFVQRDHRRIPPTLLETANVLLTEAGNLGELLLGQAFLLPTSLDVPPDQLAHVHALTSADYKL